MKKFLFILSLIFLSLPLISEAAFLRKPINNLGLQAYWSFEDVAGTSVTDFSGNGNNGTLTNMDASTDAVEGKRGTALDFDGDDDYVSIGTTEYNYANDFTVMAWIFVESTYSSGIEQIVGTNGRRWSLGTESGKVYFNAYTNTNNKPTYTPTTDEWHHVVGVKRSSGTGVELYIDGVSVDTKSATSDVNYAGSDARIGSDAFGGGRYFDGLIDEVRIYNRALTTAEVEALYSSASASYGKLNAGHRNSLTDGLVSYHSFDGPFLDSTTSTDVVGGSNATLSGPVSTRGQFGQAMTFDGTDDLIDFGSTGFRDLTRVDSDSSYTVSFWLNSDDASADIIGDFDGPGAYPILIRQSSGKIQLLHNLVSDNLAVSNTPELEWHHYVVTYADDGSGDVVIYKNGSEIGSDTGFSDPAATQDALHFGYSTGSNKYLDGSLDEVRIYSRALSASEVQALYLSGKSKIGTAGNITTEIDPSLVLHHTFDGRYLDTTTSTDISGSSNDGTLSSDLGTRPVPARGVLGQALDFERSDEDYVLITTDASLQPTAAMSMMAWINLESSTNGQTIMAHDWSSNRGWALSISPTSKNIAAKFGDGTNDSHFNSVYNHTPGFTLGEWYHVGATFDGDDMVIYLNGEAKSTYSKTTTLSYTSVLRALIGASDSIRNHFDGKIDDVRVYSRALSADEMLSMYRLGR